MTTIIYITSNQQQSFMTVCESRVNGLMDHLRLQVYLLYFRLTPFCSI